MGIKEAYERIKTRESDFEKAIEFWVNEFDSSEPRRLIGGLDSIRIDIKIIEEECPEVIQEQEGIKAVYTMIKKRKEEIAALLPLIEEDPTAHTQADGMVEGLDEALIAIESKYPEVKEKI